MSEEERHTQPSTALIIVGVVLLLIGGLLVRLDDAVADIEPVEGVVIEEWSSNTTSPGARRHTSSSASIVKVGDGERFHTYRVSGAGPPGRRVKIIIRHGESAELAPGAQSLVAPTLCFAFGGIIGFIGLVLKLARPPVKAAASPSA